MLFNSYIFIFTFLPVTFVLYFVLAKISREYAIGWLVIASLFFYGWWNPSYLPLILISMVANFTLGQTISKYRDVTSGWLYLVTGIALNLAAIGYFKYAGFIVLNINAVTHAGFSIGDVVLPLAISFFTFQQIAYLVDCYKGLTDEYHFTHYALFVTFFPQLIAGPIVHHSEMMPQFIRRESIAPRLDNVAIGLTIFFIGLFKKAVLADGAAVYASPIFTAAANGETISFFDAWGGSLCYTFQLYFDFSGYSDMAIGAARLFGVRLPLNFHSPYKSISIVEFWRRWHMTLSRFLRDYLYIALGGNRRGNVRRYVNLFATMLLGGLWHGAGWTFVAWGALHGSYLVINHAWEKFRVRLLPALNAKSPLWRATAWLITFLAVVVGWVFFRAEDFSAALAILEGMSGSNGVSLPNAIMVRLGPITEILQSAGITPYLGGGSQFVSTYLWILLLFPLSIVMPNTQEIMRNFDPALDVNKTNSIHSISPFEKLAQKITWQPNLAWACIAGLIAALGILALTNISEFLYFQF